MAITKYIWDGQNYLQETDEDDVTQVTYTNKPEQYGKLVSQRRTSEAGSEFFHFDGLGSTMELTDESSNIVESYCYTAFGEKVTTNSYTPAFAYVGALGYYRDAEIAQLSIRARFYVPATSRWLSLDPHIDDRNGYRYAGNSVVNIVDPSGLIKCAVEHGTCPLGYLDVSPLFFHNTRGAPLNTTKNANGIGIYMHYLDPGTGLRICAIKKGICCAKFAWVQVVETNWPLNARRSPYTDSGDGILPWYPANIDS